MSEISFLDSADQVPWRVVAYKHFETARELSYSERMPDENANHFRAITASVVEI